MYFKLIISSEKFIDASSIYSSDRIDVDVKLYSSSYTLITDDSDSGVDKNFNLLYRLNAGTYFLEVVNGGYQTGDFYFQCNNLAISQRVNSLDNLVTGLDSVDDDNEIIYQVSTTFPYMENLNDAILSWNNLQYVSIINENSTNKNITIRIDSFYENNNIDGIWSKDGVTLAGPGGDIPIADLLMVNEYSFEEFEYSDNQITRILMHELGHALGLHEFNSQLPFSTGGNNSITQDKSIQNVMRQMNTALQELGPVDIEVYMYLWGD